MSVHARQGERVELEFTSDEFTSIKPGTRGKVTFVDSLGTVHVKWDDGHMLGLVPGHDRWKVVNEDSQTENAAKP